MALQHRPSPLIDCQSLLMPQSLTPFNCIKHFRARIWANKGQIMIKNVIMIIFRRVASGVPWFLHSLAELWNCVHFIIRIFTKTHLDMLVFIWVRGKLDYYNMAKITDIGRFEGLLCSSNACMEEVSCLKFIGSHIGIYPTYNNTTIICIIYSFGWG